MPRKKNRIERQTTSRFKKSNRAFMQNLILSLHIFVALMLMPLLSAAGDLSRDVRTGVSNPQAGESNYIELGMSLGAYTSPFYGVPEGNEKNKNLLAASLDLNLHLQYKGFFMEGFSQSLEQFTFGYHWKEGERWSLDVVSLEQHQELSSDESEDLQGLKTRHSDYMFGLRATGYYEKYIFQMHGLTDISGVHNGQVLSFKLARHWQYKNWNIHAIASTSYRTQPVANYYFGVKLADATEKFTPFDAEAGFIQAYEVGVSYPLSQKWVFRSLYRHVELSQEWKNSPLLTSNQGNILLNSITYVF